MTPARELRLHPEAEADACSAYRWYFERSEPAARAFVEELDLALERIAEAPSRWPTWKGGTRRHLLHRFPFFIVYRQAGEEIQILAIAHARRRPGYWRGR